VGDIFIEPDWWTLSNDAEEREIEYETYVAENGRVTQQEIEDAIDDDDKGK